MSPSHSPTNSTRNPIVACVGPNGSRIYRRLSSAKAWRLWILPNRPATDGHGKPLPDKPMLPLGQKATTQPKKGQPS